MFVTTASVFLIYMYLQYCIHPPILTTDHPSIYPSTNPSIHLWSIHPFIHPSILSTDLQIIHSPFDPSIYSSIHPSIHPPFIHPSTYPFIHLSIYQPILSTIHPPIDPSTYPNLHLFIHSLIHLSDHILFIMSSFTVAGNHKLLLCISNTQDMLHIEPSWKYYYKTVCIKLIFIIMVTLIFVYKWGNVYNASYWPYSSFKVCSHSQWPQN